MGALEGKRVLVTGAAQGIGNAIARRAQAEGARLCLTDRDEDLVAQGLRRLAGGGKAYGFAADVRSRAEVEEMVGKAHRALGGFDVLVCAAGVFPDDLFLEMTEEAWDLVLDTNAKGTFLVCQAVARRMVADGAPEGTFRHIVTISSGSHRLARVGSAHYCASKAAVVMLTRTMALELAPHRILVNSVAPGLIDHPGLSAAYREAFRQGVPLGRIGQPEDVAEVVLMLVASHTTYVTGQVIAVDGGSTAGRFGLPLSHGGGPHAGS